MRYFKSHKKILITALSLLLSAALLLGGCGIYLLDYYKADEAAIASYVKDLPVRKEPLEDGSFVFLPEGTPRAGLIFYPGGKVEEEAYIPLLSAFAKEGILCILVKMPFRLAIFDVDAAKDLRGLYPEITRWYIGGHSLGGAAASMHLEKESAHYEGLLLLAAYSSADLSKTTLRVLSLYGSNDLVLNREKYEDSLKNLPKGYTEQVLEGGCHAHFGFYGAQKGDGTPTVSASEQIEHSAEIFASFLDEQHERKD
jgi:hypothetical protein